MVFDANREAEILEGIAKDRFRARPDDIQASQRLCDEWQHLSRREKSAVVIALNTKYGHDGLQSDQPRVSAFAVLEGSASKWQIGDLESVTFNAPKAAHPGAEVIKLIDDGDKTKIRTNNILLEASKRDRMGPA